jgi:extracellular factor (EF) 3-hydroxypalmitic acid methyl ester biosynthesis protein
MQCANDDVINRTYDNFAADLTIDPGGGVARRLIHVTDRIRRGLEPDEWKRCATEVLARHPVAELLRQDPYTRRAYEKPRGYAGDAVTLDYLYYGLSDSFKHHRRTTVLGRAVFKQTVGSPSGEAVRNRRGVLAKIVDETAESVPSPVVVSVACGHMREIAFSSAFRAGEVGVWFGVDQDTESLQIVDAQYEDDSKVFTLAASVRELLKGDADIPAADLIYSAGLFDYLDDQAVIALIACLFRKLKPGGRVLIANFAEDSEERGYMEAFMDWWLLYRAESHLMELGKIAIGSQRAEMSTFRDASRRAIFLSATAHLI